MPEAKTGLSWRRGKCAGKSLEINEMRQELVFHGSDQECPHNPNEISALWAELVFRELPGESVQWGG